MRGEVLGKMWVLGREARRSTGRDDMEMKMAGTDVREREMGLHFFPRTFARFTYF